jgi:hypothetical protein
MIPDQVCGSACLQGCSGNYALEAGPGPPAQYEDRHAQQPVAL